MRVVNRGCRQSGLLTIRTQGIHRHIAEVHVCVSGIRRSTERDGIARPIVTASGVADVSPVDHMPTARILMATRRIWAVTTISNRGRLWILFRISGIINWFVQTFAAAPLVF